MPFIFLSEQHHLTLEDLQDGPFYTNDRALSYIVQVPNRYAPVWCEYTGNRLEYHSWTNPISGRIYEKTHPLGFTEKSDNSFFDGFYEITPIDLTFRKGEAWCPDKTNQKIPVEKTDQPSIWNPFYQRYDPPCNRDEHDCDVLIPKIKYDRHESVHKIFEKDIDLFTTVYCPCCICKRCHNVHEWDCDNDSSRTMEL